MLACGAICCFNFISTPMCLALSNYAHTRPVVHVTFICNNTQWSQPPPQPTVSYAYKLFPRPKKNLRFFMITRIKILFLKVGKNFWHSKVLMLNFTPPQNQGLIISAISGPSGFLSWCVLLVSLCVMYKRGAALYKIVRTARFSCRGSKLLPRAYALSN